MNGVRVDVAVQSGQGVWVARGVHHVQMKGVHVGRGVQVVQGVRVAGGVMLNKTLGATTPADGAADTVALDNPIATNARNASPSTSAAICLRMLSVFAIFSPPM